MIFAHFRTEVNEANIFVVACETTRQALLLDAAVFDPRLPLFFEAHQLTLGGIFITHAHFDHTGGLADILRWNNAPVYGRDASIDGRPVIPVRQGDVIHFGKVEGRVIELPGHTPCSLGLVIPGMVFTGDALFAGSIGGTSDDGKREQEIRGIQEHVFTLPEDFLIHTGHGPSTTVRIEKNYNPFFV